MASPEEEVPDSKEPPPRERFDTCAARLPSIAATGVASGEAGPADLGNGVARAVAKSKKEVRFELDVLFAERRERVLSSLGPLPKTDEAFAEGEGVVMCCRWIGP